jgi:hypothetical protein
LNISRFDAAIGLASKWPVEEQNKERATATGFVLWATAYLQAAEQLHLMSKSDRQLAFYAGPVIHNTGLAAELTLKAFLQGGGKTEKEIKKIGHNTYDAYCLSREYFEEIKFIELHFSNTAHLTVPDEVRRRSDPADEEVETRWKVYFDHLRLLDTVYDRPFKGRYFQPGAVQLPETEIVLIGTKILLSALKDRLDDRAKSST